MNTTRAQLLDAARAHLDVHGLDGLTLRQIARTTGVSHGAPLRHFSGLSTLLAAVAAVGFDNLVAEVSAQVEAAGTDPLGRLRAAGRGYIKFAIEERGTYELMFRPERLDRTEADYRRASSASFAQLVAFTAAAQATGWNRHIDPPVLTGVMWACVHGIASLWIQGALSAATGNDDHQKFIDAFQIDLASLPATKGAHSC